VVRALLTLALLVAAACAPATAERPLTIAAAASLRDLVTEAAQRFAVEHNVPEPTLVFEASSTLARQIAEGGAVDVFLSADRESIERAAPRLEPTGARVFLANELVLAMRSDLRDPPTDPAAFVAAGLTLGLAGEAVPAGRYARAYLRELGIWEQLEGRIALASNVRATLALLQSGAVDGVFVYRTDAIAAAQDVVVVHAATRDSAPVVYVAAAVTPARGGPHPMAQAFLDHLGSAEFLALATARGFLAPD